MNSSELPALKPTIGRSVIRYRLRNDPVVVSDTVVEIRNRLVGDGVLDESRAFRAMGAVDEALQNSLFHGNLEVDSALREAPGDAYHALAKQRRSEEPYASRRIDLVIVADDDSVRFTVSDEGPGFDVSEVKDPTAPENITRVHGRGLVLMRAFCDELRFNDRGNEVTMVVRRVPE